MPRNRLQITAFVTSTIQIGLCALAIWSMWDTAKTSDQFSTGALDTHFQYTQRATLLPDVLLTVFVCGLLCATFWNRRPLASWIYAALQILAILIIACVWLTLSRVDFAYATFFVAQGPQRNHGQFLAALCRGPAPHRRGTAWPNSARVVSYSLGCHAHGSAWACLNTRRN